ncbi:hypothetical protein PUNSTDRAFT_108731 [Punctularia strigosozonata HHB-11173 SS5]|uniref:Golgi apparatus membrane protein TVP38 n=1 Tax=Punctularia strigosozonata (strain HHB-11173) TaxID=741275 RepID=R7S225_PUNST|nr:uncharacterized protein PUNSTDRAFT_108731 [Punctularia strigosozonata HHB-11173 SS5]EIN03919.1 hypothetical protein PUNSTDRAFT_108731 [Punctularia strigosozonata HHB-11173 SS5]
MSFAVPPYPSAPRPERIENDGLSQYPPYDSRSVKPDEVTVETFDRRSITRTPSPTPSEQEYLSRDTMLDPKAMFRREYWRKPKNLINVAITVFAITVAILISVYQKKIFQALKPFSNWMHDTPGGWLIPIALLIVLSFPPLFGHEIVAILCGVVYGLGIGFVIVAVGTLIGESLNFAVFHYFCRERAGKLEKKEIFYGCLARVVREGGFKIALISRYSAIPGHLTTALYSTCGLGFWIFLAAAVLSLPKQFVLIAVGVLSEDAGEGKGPKGANTISIIVSIILGVATSLAYHYILKKMAAVKNDIIYQRRKERQRKTAFASSSDEALIPSYKSDAWQPGHHAGASSSSSTIVGGGVVRAPQPVRVGPAASEIYDKV